MAEPSAQHPIGLLFIGHLVNHKWENCLTIDMRSWGYRREATLSDFESIEDLIKQLASTVR